MAEAEFEVRKTTEFDEWSRDQKDTMQTRIDARIELASSGRFVNSKPLGSGLLEFKWNDGLRVYYSRTKVGEADIIVLLGGDKSSQDRDINKARKLKDQIELENQDDDDN